MTELAGFGRKSRLTGCDPEPGVGSEVTDSHGVAWRCEVDSSEDVDLPWFAPSERRGNTWQGITADGPVTVTRYVARSRKG